ncbi:MAG: DNA recombination protein RmuC [bacterium]|nr:DNA recombination protein RmuC [bacterium]
MEAVFLIMVLVIVVVGFAGIFWLLSMKKNAPGESEKLGAFMERLSQLVEQNRELRQTLDAKLSETHRVNQQQFTQATQLMQGISGQSAKLIAEVTEKLTKLDETNKQVINFSGQLQNLQDILKNPKQRGILGEYYLETVLKNVLPPGSYQMQYPFSDKVIVDAVVFLDKRIIPIDSKFSLENYNRILEARDPTEKKRYEAALVADLKTRIDETAKYVKPEENTTDFAFMFIPSEAVYYDLLINKVGAVEDNTRNLIHYAGQKKVIIVSPTSFLAYLQTVLQGLKNQKISEQAKVIIKQVENLGKHLISFEDYLQRIGKNLGTTVSMYNNAYKEFGKIDKDVFRITGEAPGIEPVVIKKPEDVEE